jgi:hypothetical protein
MTLEHLAADYGCSRRTLSRMKSAGVNIHDPAEVAAHVAQLRSPSGRMINALLVAIARTTLAAGTSPWTVGFIAGVR